MHLIPAAANAYNTQALIVLIFVNLILLGWVGLVWAGYVRGRIADRVLVCGVFLALAVMMVHAFVAPSLAR
jgi:hypothetical protein